MKLFELYRGKSKKRMHLVMVDSLKKVENYRDAVLVSHLTHSIHFDIRPAQNDAKVWKKNSSNQWTNYDSPYPQKIKS